MLKWEAREGLDTPERRIEAAERVLGFILAYDAARRGEFRVAAAEGPAVPVTQPPWVEVHLFDSSGKVVSTFRHGLQNSLLSIETELKRWLWGQIRTIIRLRDEHGNRTTAFA